MKKKKVRRSWTQKWYSTRILNEFSWYFAKKFVHLSVHLYIFAARSRSHPFGALLLFYLYLSFLLLSLFYFFFLCVCRSFSILYIHNNIFYTYCFPLHCLVALPRFCRTSPPNCAMSNFSFVRRSFIRSVIRSLGQFNEQNTSLNHFHVSFTWLIPLRRGWPLCSALLRDTVVIRFVNAVIRFSSFFFSVHLVRTAQVAAAAHGMKWNENGVSMSILRVFKRLFILVIVQSFTRFSIPPLYFALLLYQLANLHLHSPTTKTYRIFVCVRAFIRRVNVVCGFLNPRSIIT